VRIDADWVASSTFGAFEDDAVTADNRMSRPLL
jgi:hypothetical protein